MKAERRHELKTNALARGLTDFPDFWREYGSRILLAVVVGLLVYLGVKYWGDRKANNARRVVDALQTLQTVNSDLEIQPRQYSRQNSERLHHERQVLRQEADSAVNTLLDLAKDSRTRANAYLGKGEVDWKLANLPALPGADTEPSLEVKPEERDRLLNDARTAYEEAIRESSDAYTVLEARLGLAAIAENLGQWDKARQQYELLANSAEMPPALKQYTAARIADLPQYEKPVLIGPPPLPVEMPGASTQAATQLFGQTSSQPTTEPTATTTPASQPASRAAQSRPRD